MCVIRVPVDLAGLSAVWPVMRAVSALLLEMTSNTPLRTRLSAPLQVSVAMEATRHGTGLRGPVLSLVVITQMPALVKHVCLTALRHALTMCLPPQNTLHAHQANIHLHHVIMHAPTPG